MMRLSRYMLIGWTGLLCCAGAVAGTLSELLSEYQEVTRQGKPMTTLGIENDSLLMNRDDGFYSSGLQVTHQHMVQREHKRLTAGWRIGQQLYTASNINRSPEKIAPNDHPYAGWLYGGWFRQVSHSNGTHLELGVDIGCLGPCAGGEGTQTFLHRVLNQPLPRGWSKQVRQEWGMIVYGQTTPVTWQLLPGLKASPVIHGRFGNIHTDAGMGLALKAGQSSLSGEPVGLHGFARSEIRFVAYNAMLQGGYFSSGNPHTVKPRRAVGEAELGVGWHEGSYRITASLVRRGSEIAGLTNELGAQNFVRLLFSYTP